MRLAALLPLALVGALPARAATTSQGHDAGAVVLLGERARAATVPELGRQALDVLLVAQGETTPGPIDARAWGGGRATTVVRLDPRADLERALLARVRAARSIALGPGSVREWLDALLRSGKAGATLRALREAWGDGALLVGRGDSAALLSTAFVVEGAGELGWDERNPRLQGRPRGAHGLGCQPWALIDTGGRAGGSLERLARRLIAGDHDLGLYLGATAAVVVEPRGELRAHGDEPLILVDARGARRDRAALRAARWTLLEPGARWDASRREALGERRPGPVSGSTRSLALDDVLSAAQLCASLLGAAQGVAADAWILTDGRQRLVLVLDEDASWYAAGASAARTLAGARGDLEL